MSLVRCMATVSHIICYVHILLSIVIISMIQIDECATTGDVCYIDAERKRTTMEVSGCVEQKKYNDFFPFAQLAAHIHAHPGAKCVCIRCRMRVFYADSSSFFIIGSVVGVLFVSSTAVDFEVQANWNRISDQQPQMAIFMVSTMMKIHWHSRIVDTTPSLILILYNIFNVFVFGYQLTNIWVDENILWKKKITNAATNVASFFFWIMPT